MSLSLDCGYNKNATSPRPVNKETQDTGTPLDFFNVIKEEFAPQWDLAAHRYNTKCDNFISLDGLKLPEQSRFPIQADSLAYPWYTLSDGWLWLNPPFAKIEPWVAKAYMERLKGAKILVLVPASVDSNWFEDWVENKATEVRFLNPRLKFVGHTNAYPKPLMLIVYDGDADEEAVTHFWQFRWKEFMKTGE